MKKKIRKKEGEKEGESAIMFQQMIALNRHIKVLEYKVDAAKQILGNIALNKSLPVDVKKLSAFWLGFFTDDTALIDTEQFMPDVGNRVIGYFPDEKRYADLIFTKDEQWAEPLPIELAEMINVKHVLHPRTAVSHWLIRPGEPIGEEINFKEEEE